jgi:hypothetical protein
MKSCLGRTQFNYDSDKPELKWRKAEQASNDRVKPNMETRSLIHLELGKCSLRPSFNYGHDDPPSRTSEVKLNPHDTREKGKQAREKQSDVLLDQEPSVDGSSGQKK